MIGTEDAKAIADAINATRPGIQVGPTRAVSDIVIDRVARSVAEALYPVDCLTQNCTRRAFLLASGVHGG